MTETSCRSDIDVMHLDGFNVVNLNKKSKKSGAVCLHVKAGLKYERNKDLSLCTDDIEALTLKFKMPEICVCSNASASRG